MSNAPRENRRVTMSPITRMLGAMSDVRESQPVHIAKGSVLPGWLVKMVAAVVTTFGGLGILALVSLGGHLADAKTMRRDIDKTAARVQDFEEKLEGLKQQVKQTHTILCMQCVEQFGRDRCGDKAACKL